VATNQFSPRIPTDDPACDHLIKCSPLLPGASSGSAYRTKNVASLKGLLARKGANRIHDDVVRDFLHKQYDRLTA
jgi:hypothetical protein